MVGADFDVDDGLGWWWLGLVRLVVVGAGTRLVVDTVVVGAVVATTVDGPVSDAVELDPVADALVGLGPFVGRDVPHAPAVMTVTTTMAKPTTPRRSGGDGRRLTGPG